MKTTTIRRDGKKDLNIHMTDAVNIMVDNGTIKQDTLNKVLGYIKTDNLDDIIISTDTKTEKSMAEAYTKYSKELLIDCILSTMIYILVGLMCMLFVVNGLSSIIASKTTSGFNYISLCVLIVALSLLMTYSINELIKKIKEYLRVRNTVKLSKRIIK